MSIVDKVKKAMGGSKTPTEARKAADQKETKARENALERAQEISRRKNSCRIMLNESEKGFERIMNREVKNARTAMELGIDYTLNRNQFSDAASGIKAIKQARWYLDSMTSDAGLHGALRLLDQALKTMNKIDGGTQVVNEKSLRSRLNELYELENVTEDSAVLPPLKEFDVKFENGLFDNMVKGMSYDEAAKFAHQDLTAGGANYSTTTNYGDIFAAKEEADPNAAERRRAAFDNRMKEL